jgi:molecular chaperone GrpE
MTDPSSKQRPELNEDAPAETENGVATPINNEDALIKQVAELKDQLLRALAEAENTRRRSQKEREDTAKYAVTNFAREMLNVADNFRRALDATPKDSNDKELKNLVVGLEATERQMQAALEQFGIKKIEPMGLPFDPNFHRAMAEIDHSDQSPGTVVQVLQAGYVIHDRLLREALVAIAKGSSRAQSTVDTSA